MLLLVVALDLALSQMCYWPPLCWLVLVVVAVVLVALYYWPPLCWLVLVDGAVVFDALCLGQHQLAAQLEAVCSLMWEKLPNTSSSVHSDALQLLIRAQRTHKRISHAPEQMHALVKKKDACVWIMSSALQQHSLHLGRLKSAGNLCEGMRETSTGCEHMHLATHSSTALCFSPCCEQQQNSSNGLAFLLHLSFHPYTPSEVFYPRRPLFLNALTQPQLMHVPLLHDSSEQRTKGDAQSCQCAPC